MDPKNDSTSVDESSDVSVGAGDVSSAPTTPSSSGVQPMGGMGVKQEPVSGVSSTTTSTTDTSKPVMQTDDEAVVAQEPKVDSTVSVTTPKIVSSKPMGSVSPTTKPTSSPQSASGAQVAPSGVGSGSMPGQDSGAVSKSSSGMGGGDSTSSDPVDGGSVGVGTADSMPSPKDETTI